MDPPGVFPSANLSPEARQRFIEALADLLVADLVNQPRDRDPGSFADSAPAE
jgi:hypothetical protein